MKNFLIFPVFLFLSSSLLATELDISKMRDPKSVIANINKGYDINAVRASDGYTLVHYAAELGNVELVKLLIKKGANLNPAMKRGNTPLSTAITFDKKEIIRLLLEAGVDPNFKLGEFDYLRTHFHFFVVKARKIDKSLFDLFVAKGTELEARDSFTDTPLISASDLEFSMRDNVKFLIGAGADIKAENKFGKTPLMTAVFVQNIELIKFLLESGAPIDQKDKEGNTALIAMVGMGAGVNSDKLKPQIMEILIEAGAKVDESNHAGNTVLHEAVVSNNISLLQFLSHQNPNTTLQNKKKKTALDQAIINENWEAVKVLLPMEKDLDRLDSYGSTMLHSAVMNEKIILIKLLLAAGADKEARDKWGKSAIEFAKSQGNSKILELFSE